MGEGFSSLPKWRRPYSLASLVCTSIRRLSFTANPGGVAGSTSLLGSAALLKHFPLIRQLATTIAAIVYLIACSHVVAPPKPGELSTDQISSDIKYVQMVVESAHPNPFFHETRQRFEASIESIGTGAKSGLSAEGFYRQLAPAIAELGDSHTNLDTYTKAYQEFRKGNGRLFPLELRVVDRRAFVTANYGPENTIPLGAELSSINGLTIPIFLDRLGRFVGAERTALRDSFVAQDVRAYMWHAGMNAPFHVAFYGRGRRETSQTLRGTTVAAIHAWDNSNAGYDALTPFRMDYADKGAIGVLTIHSFDNPDGWRDFTRRLVEEMKARGTRALIIDLRMNSGGNTDTSDAFLSNSSSPQVP